MTASIVVLFNLGTTGVAFAQLLGRASSAVHGSDDSGGQSDDDDEDYDYDYGSDDDDYGQDDDGLIGSASGAVHGSSSGRSRGSGRSFRSGRPIAFGHVLGSAPYVGGNAGYARPMVEDGQEYEPRMGGRISAELGYALGGAGRAAVAGRLSFPFLLDVVTRYSFFVEPTEGGLQAAALGRVGLELRIVDVPALQIRIGGGLRHFQDVVGGAFGGDGTLGIDIYPGEPVILSLEVGGGAVGQAAVVVARGSLGFIIDNTEIFAGYHYEGLFAGPVHVDLGGPMLGVRAWL